MKIGNWELKFFKEKFQSVEKVQTEVELGQSGTTIFNGFIADEDYVRELVGSTAIITYDKMRRSDGVVKAAILACELPIRAANWFIQPASDDEKDKEVAAFISDALFEKMSITWDDFLRQALLMLPFGYSVFEKVFKPIDFNGKQMIGWRKFAPRLQKTILKWKTETNEDGITQQTYTGTNNVSIPISKLLIFTHQKEGDNWVGISILRSAYRPWYFKNHIEKINAIAFERQGLGIPYGKLPKNFTVADRDKLEELLKNIRANEAGYLIEPDGWEIGFKDMKAGTLMNPDETIRRYNREILISVLAQFLDLGSGPTGSRALSADHSSTFHNNLTAVAKTIQDIINKYAIRQLVDLNYTVAKYPTLEYSYIGLPRYLEVSQALNNLINIGAVKIDDKLEDYLRQLMNLPKKVEIEEKNKVKIEKELSEFKFRKRQANEFVGWRPLTFAERKVNFADIREKMDSAAEKLSMKLTDAISKTVDDLVRQFQMVLETTDNTKKRELLTKMKVSNLEEYRKVLYASIMEMFQYGKTMAAHEMKKTPPVTPPSFLQVMANLADNLTDIMVNDLIKEGKLVLLVGLQQKQFSETLSKIIAGLKNRAKEIVLNASVLNVSSALSQGRRATFSIYGSDIYALQRSEILDTTTCDYCLSIDSRVFNKDDSFTKIDSIHSNCRGLWVEILSEETEKPSITGIPQSLRDAFDSVNVFKPPKRPIVKKESPAAEFLKQEKESSDVTERLNEKIELDELKKSVDELKEITDNKI